jgi:tungstate transport system permease protein
LHEIAVPATIGNVDTLAQSFALALRMLVHLDPQLTQIVGLSLAVSLTSTLCSALIGLPLGAAVAIARFPGRNGVIVALNAAMGLPPVVVGLAVYLLLSRAGPLGELGLLFTPPAMVIAQTILVVPIVAALTRQVIEDAWVEYREQLQSLHATWWQAALTLLWDTRFSLLTVLLAGFGRAAAEVGAVIIVGGNIDGVTRVMTTAIALETSKGDLPLALGLGLVLITLVMALNVGAYVTRGWARARFG